MEYSLLGEGFEKDCDKAFSWQFFIHFPGDKEKNTDFDCSLIHSADLSWQCHQLLTHIFSQNPCLKTEIIYYAIVVVQVLCIVCLTQVKCILCV